MAEVKPDWVKMKLPELEKIVVELAKAGESPAKIGIILRDKHGVPKAKLVGKRILQILKEKGIEVKSEKQNLQDSMKNLGEHIAKNKHDYNAKKSLAKKLWTVAKLKN